MNWLLTLAFLLSAASHFAIDALAQVGTPPGRSIAGDTRSRKFHPALREKEKCLKARLVTCLRGAERRAGARVAAGPARACKRSGDGALSPKRAERRHGENVETVGSRAPSLRASSA